MAEQYNCEDTEDEKAKKSDQQSVTSFDDLINALGFGRWTVLMISSYICCKCNYNCIH